MGPTVGGGRSSSCDKAAAIREGPRPSALGGHARSSSVSRLPTDPSLDAAARSSGEASCSSLSPPRGKGERSTVDTVRTSRQPGAAQGLIELSDDQCARLIWRADNQSRFNYLASEDRQGGFNLVQKVHDEMFYDGMETVALRTVIDPSAPGAPTPASFRSEAMLMDSLGELDFVARILAVHWASMTMVLEWIPGGSIKERYEDEVNEWTLHDRLACSLCIAEGAVALQTILGPGKAVVHIDVKVRKPRMTCFYPVICLTPLSQIPGVMSKASLHPLPALLLSRRT